MPGVLPPFEHELACNLAAAPRVNEMVDYAGELGMLNAADLSKILKWNVSNNIKCFRLSSEFFPWASEYNFKDLPQYQRIKTLLAGAGNYAKQNGLRLTSHPGPFNVLVSPREHVVENTITDLRIHGEIFDMLGLSLSLIHI